MTFWAHRHHSDEAQSSAVPWPAAALNFLMRLGFHRTRRPIADAERSAAENPPVENSLKLMIWLNCAVVQAELKIAGRWGRAHLKRCLKSQHIDLADCPGVMGLIQRLRVVAYEAGRCEGAEQRSGTSCLSPLSAPPGKSYLIAWLQCAVADAEARITGRRDQAYLRTFLKSRRIDPDAKPQVFGLVERLRWAAYEAGRLEGESAPSAGRGSPTLGTSPRRV